MKLSWYVTKLVYMTKSYLGISTFPIKIKITKYDFVIKIKITKYDFVMYTDFFME